tara:strand:- start:142 stop:1338 length:1197 start_codon:yes stop_codon:yes gene_type:complete
MPIKSVAKALLKVGRKAAQKTNPASALRIARSNFTDQKLLGPHALREQMVRNPEQLATGAEEALLKYNTPVWTDAATGEAKQIRNYGSKVMRTQGMPLQVNDAVNRVNTRGNQPDQPRAQNILATTQGKQDFATYKGDEGFPRTKREVAKILNIPVTDVEQHHLNGAAHWGWLFRGTTEAQAKEMHEILEQSGIVLGNKRFNRVDLPTAVHDVLHRTLEARGLIHPKGDFSKIPFDQRKELLARMMKDQAIVNEITYDLMRQYQGGVPADKLEYGKNPAKPKNTEPTQFPEQIQRHIARSAEIGITEPVWKSGSIDYTWRPETNTGQIDIPPQSTKGFKGLRDEFFEQIENLPSGSVWELNPKFKDEKRRRIYARLFGNDPRITRNQDPTLGWVLRVP